MADNPHILARHGELKEDDEEDLVQNVRVRDGFSPEEQLSELLNRVEQTQEANHFTNNIEQRIMMNGTVVRS